MKCPQCSANHKYKNGMRCWSCNYAFALNPKEKPNVSDMAFKMAIDKLSGPDQHYFTYNQLYARIYRMVSKKEQKKRIGVAVAFGFIGFILLSVITGVLLSGMLGMDGSGWSLPVIMVFSITGSVWYAKRPVTVSPHTVTRLISKYKSLHPIDRLVEEKQWLQSEPTTFDSEILDYAPERILIVERDDMAYMLLMNRFHFENKTLVLSAEKRPENAFKAFQAFRKQHPQIPIFLIHDASEKGGRLKEKLIADKAWHLTDENIQDLGLFPQDVERLKNPVIFPEAEPDAGTDKIDQEFMMPADVAPSRAIMGAMAIAVVSGFPLLSEQLLAEQQRHTDGDVYDFGGSG